MRPKPKNSHGRAVTKPYYTETTLMCICGHKYVRIPPVRAQIRRLPPAHRLRLSRLRYVVVVVLISTVVYSSGTMIFRYPRITLFLVL